MLCFVYAVRSVTSSTNTTTDVFPRWLTWVAGLSLPVVHTVAVEVIQQVDTLASVLTGVSVAFVHIWSNSRSVKLKLSAVYFCITWLKPNYNSHSYKPRVCLLVCFCVFWVALLLNIHLNDGVICKCAHWPKYRTVDTLVFKAHLYPVSWGSYHIFPLALTRQSLHCFLSH